MNKQQLQQEIEALKKQLEEKQKALAAMPEKWEPKGGEWFIDIFGEASTTSMLAREVSVFGLAYTTREQAEKASKAMRAHNRLLAYVAEFAPDYGFRTGEKNWFVCYSHEELGWITDFAYDQAVGAVYMREKDANTLAYKLNSGDVEL